MWIPCGCCKPELTEEQKRNLLIQKVRKTIEKGQLNKFKTLMPSIEEFGIDMNVQVAVETHWTRYLQIAVTKTLRSHNTRQKYLNIVDILLQNGADLKATDEFGHSPIDDIDKCPELIRKFVEYGYEGELTDLIDGMPLYDDKTPKKVKKNKVQPLELEEPLLAADGDDTQQ